MSLQERLDAQKRKFESSAPKEILDVMQRASEDLYKSGIMKRAARRNAGLGHISSFRGGAANGIRRI